MQTAQTVAAYATVLWPLILLVITALVAFGISRVNAFVADRVKADKANQFWAQVQRLVLGAEQSIVGSHAKFAWVYSLATSAAKALGLDLTQAQITAMIEAAVAGVNQAQGQPFAATTDAHPDLVPGSTTVTPTVDDHTAVIAAQKAQIDQLQSLVDQWSTLASATAAATQKPAPATGDTSETVGANTQDTTGTDEALATVTGTVKTPDGQEGALVGRIVPPPGTAS